MRLIRQLLSPYRWIIVAILLVMVVQTLTVVAAPWPLKIVLDNVVGDHRLPHVLDVVLDPLLGGKSRMHVAGLAAVIMVLIAVVGGVAAYVVNYLTESLGQWVANDLRIRVYHHLQHLSLSYYDSHEVGPILSTVTDDVDTIEDFASSATLGMAVDVLTIGAMLGLMFWLDWDFALIAVAVAPLLLLFVFRIRRAVKAATHEVRRHQADIVTTVQQGLQSIREVKAFGRQDLEEAELARVSGRAVAAALNARRVKSLVTPTVGVVVALCTAFVLWRGSSLILQGVMTAGTLTVFIAYLGMFFKPVQDLAKMTNAIAGFSVAVERIGAIVDTDSAIQDAPSAVTPGPLRGEIAFDDVTFSYEGRTPALRGVTFAIKRGQRVGIVGHTGSGKSTILSLIPRFYDATTGTVRIDGVDVREYKLQEIRKQTGFVLQDTVLFSGSVRDNIVFGRPDAGDDEVVEAAKAANAHGFIMDMPHGYDSPVGERGVALSGGQRQRIGIARAFIRDNPILLLDEPTAALDAESERAVVDALDRLMADRTVVIIAHRFGTIRDADVILVLDHGEIAEVGDHPTLMARNGIYAELYRIQYQEESE